jgi:hypothetical protein
MADHFNGFDLNALNAMIQNADLSSFQGVLNTVDLNQVAAMMQRLFPNAVPVEYSIKDAPEIQEQYYKNASSSAQAADPASQYYYSLYSFTPSNPSAMMNNIVKAFTLFIVLSRFFPRKS